MKKLVFAYFALAALALSGCASPDKQDTAAARGEFVKLAPYAVLGIQGDATLSATQKNDKLDIVLGWDFRIRQNEKAAGLPVPSPFVPQALPVAPVPK